MKQAPLEINDRLDAAEERLVNLNSQKQELQQTLSTRSMKKIVKAHRNQLDLLKRVTEKF